jgi:hypothetical protein
VVAVEAASGAAVALEGATVPGWAADGAAAPR